MENLFARAMRQAAMTTNDYADEAATAFQKLTGFSVKDKTEAFATFASGYMQACAMDFETMVKNESFEKIAEALYSAASSIDTISNKDEDLMERSGGCMPQA